MHRRQGSRVVSRNFHKRVSIVNSWCLRLTDPSTMVTRYLYYLMISQYPIIMLENKGIMHFLSIYLCFLLQMWYANEMKMEGDVWIFKEISHKDDLRVWAYFESIRKAQGIGVGETEREREGKGTLELQSQCFLAGAWILNGSLRRVSKTAGGPQRQCIRCRRYVYSQRIIVSCCNRHQCIMCTRKFKTHRFTTVTHIYRRIYT